MFTKTTRAIAAAAAASIALTAISLTPAAAQPLATEVSYRHDGLIEPIDRITHAGNLARKS